MQTIIRGGTLITADDIYPADILIEDETIAAIGQDLVVPDARIVDASGKLVLPGGVDVHTHFDLPMFGTVSSDDHYTGHKAAAFGGTTTVIDFVSQDFLSLRQSIDAWHAKADDKAAIDFGFHMNITRLDASILGEIPTLPQEGITSLKVFTAYNQRLRLPDGDIFRVMRLAGQHGLLTLLHAENGDVIDVLVAEALAAGHTSPEWHAHTRPAWGAVEAAMRGASLAAQAEAPLYIVHMNAGGEADMLAYARSKGLPVMGETCPQYLFFSVEDMKRAYGAKWVCSPPMRSAEDHARLWRALQEGTIQVVGTDHCPFFYNGREPINYEGVPVRIAGKELGAEDFTRIPNGLPGVGDRLPVMWTYGVGAGRLTPNQFVALHCTNPAKIFGLYPRKGTLLPGADADIVLWDAERTLNYGIAYAQHRTDYNLYENWHLQGFPDTVWLRGQVIVQQGQWLGRSGQGRFVPRRAHAPVL